jgi:flagellar basal-body rod modification protein FlgD
MVSQMATVANSSGIAEMNKSLKSIQTQLSDNRLGGAASWIGHSMLVASNIAAPDAAGQYSGQISLGASASAVSVDLVDGSGSVVHTMDLGARQAGDTPFYWDGTDGAGNNIANTPLQVRVRGATPTSVATWASIAAVQSPADGTATKLITSLGSYNPSDALSLS